MRGNEFKNVALQVWDEAGVLRANGRELLSLPAAQWVKIAMACQIGVSGVHTYDVQVRLPGEAQTRAFAGVPYPEAFQQLDWVGFISPGSEAGVCYVDDIDLSVVKGQ